MNASLSSKQKKFEITTLKYSSKILTNESQALRSEAASGGY